MSNKMLASWEHTMDRLMQRVEPDNRDAVLRRITQIMEPYPMDAPPEAVGHYEWYLEVGGKDNDVVARIICRGIALRTVYGPLMEGGMPPPKPGSYRYKIDKKTRTFVKTY
jgi:hypothetical protein